MERYTIAWADGEGEHVEGPYAESDGAAKAAHAAANRVQRPVQVLRRDGTILMTIRPEAPTMVAVRRPRA